MTAIVLTWAEVMVAAQTGILRRVTSLRSGITNRRFGPDRDWDIDIEGAAGEMAVAKAIQRYWTASVRNYRGADVAAFHVRQTRDDRRRLIVRDDDPNDDAIFVLVTGAIPRFAVHGWIYARDAKRPEYRDNPGGDGAAFFVPIDRLQPITTLPGIAA